MRRAKDPRILVFDSGFGGLSVLSALVATLPYADYVYLADDARFPYGDLRDEALIDGLEVLLAAACADIAPDLIVIACNTASTVALERLRAAFPIPIVGIVPGIKPAARASHSGHFAVLATPGTIRRSLTRDLVRDHAQGCEVDLIACHRLAGLAERFVLEGFCDLDVLRADIVALFEGPNSATIDVVVLGCTHYPLILPMLQKVVEHPVLWLDPAPAVARRVMHLLQQEWQDCLAGERLGAAQITERIRFLATGDGQARLERAWAALVERAA
ncbi:glutamate racemase [Cohaesibacter intestini]|uniref:glutamate racemase n=1 Tax=Cohaesibacter intestini TaxID=2211145 RepID=UPI000DE837AF|nr:glutamate racemase [Cohaesibacter intestini]